jgi:hypothetical protein
MTTAYSCTQCRLVHGHQELTLRHLLAESTQQPGLEADIFCGATRLPIPSQLRRTRGAVVRSLDYPVQLRRSAGLFALARCQEPFSILFHGAEHTLHRVDAAHGRDAYRVLHVFSRFELCGDLTFSTAFPCDV